MPARGFSKVKTFCRYICLVKTQRVKARGVPFFFSRAPRLVSFEENQAPSREAAAPAKKFAPWFGQPIRFHQKSRRLDPALFAPPKPFFQKLPLIIQPNAYFSGPSDVIFPLGVPPRCPPLIILHLLRKNFPIYRARLRAESLLHTGAHLQGVDLIGQPLGVFFRLKHRPSCTVFFHLAVFLSCVQMFVSRETNICAPPFFCANWVVRI